MSRKGHQPMANQRGIGRGMVGSISWVSISFGAKRTNSVEISSTRTKTNSTKNDQSHAE
ncbi:MAG: hypothetical protein K2N01_02465 [Lachnospiraceae bacterium]|nr:hypothetical protein [Lachnospiraceae bacterium]